MVQKTEISSNNATKFNELYEAFKKANERIEAVNKITGTLDSIIEIPSLNELRYVGFHLIKALSHPDSTEEDEELRRAIRHCERASYDILELGINYQLLLVENFKKEFRKTPITSVVKEWLTICNRINQINLELVEFNRYDEGGEDYHKIAENNLSELHGITSKFPYYREELKKERTRDLLKYFFMYSGWFIALISIVVTLMALLSQNK